MAPAPLFITGTGTGVGKTLLTALLAAHLRHHGHRVAALKPVCSGGRGDAELLATALVGDLTLDEINPWYFPSPVAPVLAARREGRSVTRAQIIAHARTMQKRFPRVLIEGAGGLLSPLGEKVDSRDLIAALRATPVIVAPNQLGVINDLRLTLGTLPPSARRRALVVLMLPQKIDAATRSNVALLAEYVSASQIIPFPRLPHPIKLSAAWKNHHLRAVLPRICLVAA